MLKPSKLLFWRYRLNTTRNSRTGPPKQTTSTERLILTDRESQRDRCRVVGLSSYDMCLKVERFIAIAGTTPKKAEPARTMPNSNNKKSCEFRRMFHRGRRSEFKSLATRH